MKLKRPGSGSSKKKASASSSESEAKYVELEDVPDTLPKKAAGKEENPDKDIEEAIDVRFSNYKGKFL